MGLNVGIEYLHPLNETGLNLFVGADICFNPLSSDAKDDIEDTYQEDEYKFPKYFNIPITAGLNYSYSTSQKLSVFGKAGISLNFLKITNMEIRESPYVDTFKYDIASSFGYIIGGGVVVNDKTTIGISYLGLGEHDIDFEWEETGGGYKDDGKGELERKINIVTLTLGFKF